MNSYLGMFSMCFYDYDMEYIIMFIFIGQNDYDVYPWLL